MGRFEIRSFVSTSVILLASFVLFGCKEDPLKDWTNSKLNAKAASCAKTTKHTPRSGMICNQVKESCDFRGIACR